MTKNSVFEVAWHEADRKGLIVAKRKKFSSPAARERFIEKLAEKSSFLWIDAFLDY
ncbi:MAG: hypothetical protein IJ153_05525 [Clostridia bacterium]|nr:hypothetical protein [Clostridia bacterium]MBQ9211144.1 hypothetical protein [Clostridia bacterium]